MGKVFTVVMVVARNESLALKYRPKKFSDLVGQPVVSTVLSKMLERGTLPSTFLFSGSKGLGKTSTARLVAAALLCQEADSPCSTCVSCVSCYDGNHLSVLELDAASNGTVADVRILREQVRYQTTDGVRVVVIDEAHGMSKPAFDALLKTLEEPPDNTYFLLATTEPAKIPETISSRCHHLRFSSVSSSTIVRRLAYIVRQEFGLSEGSTIPVDSYIIEDIARRAEGSLRSGVVSLDTILRAEVFTEAEYRSLFSEPDYAVEVLQAAVDGDYSSVLSYFAKWQAESGESSRILYMIVSVLTDVLSLQSNPVVAFVDKRQASVVALVPSLPHQKVLVVLGKLWGLYTRSRSSDELSAILKLTAVMIVEAFSVTVVQPPSSAAVSVDEIREQFI